MMLIILLIISVIIVLLIIISKKDDNFNMTDNNIVRSENKELSSTESPISYKKYYKPKIYITTLNEMKFYKVLLEIAKELDYTLFSQVSLYNIISIQDNKLFNDLEIDLLRYPVYNVYYKDTLKKRIQESIKEHYYQ